jgi:hypothetical protein
MEAKGKDATKVFPNLELKHSVQRGKPAARLS